MKKSVLKNLKLLTATKNMMETAEKDILEQKEGSYYYYRKGYHNGMYMRCKVEKDILQIAFFLTEYMKAGSRLPTYVVYLDKINKQFITYNRLEKKWQNAKLDRINWPGYTRYSDSIWISDKDKKTIRNYLHTKADGFKGVLEFQCAIREHDLEQKNKKTVAPWDQDMAQIKEKPKDFKDWVEKKGIDEHFIFYKYDRKGAKTGYCTYCGKEVPVSEPRHNKEGMCSCCHKKIVYKSEGKAGTVRTGDHYMYLLQRCDDGMVIRAFQGSKIYIRGEYTNAKTYHYETKRVICSDTGVPLRSYYWGDYKRRELRWISSEVDSRRWTSIWYYKDLAYISAGKVYDATLPSLSQKELAHTGLPEYLKKMDKVNPEHYLETWKKMPQIEQLVKAGLYTLTEECLDNPGKFIGFFKQTNGELVKMLGLDREKFKRLRECDGNMAYLKWLQYEKETGLKIPEHIITWFCREEIILEELAFISDKMSMVQIYNYIRRKMEEYGESSSNILIKWSDYLEMAEGLHMDTNDAIVYRVNKLYERHDELVIQMELKDLMPKMETIAQKYPNIDNICQSVKDIYSYSQEDYTVIGPDSMAEIFKEGVRLHLCLNRIDKYWDRIEREESYIFFLRKTKELDKAYYMVEIEPDGTVRQIRTDYDRQNKDILDARSFLKRWQKEISKRLTAREHNLAKKSRILRLEEFAELRKNRITINTGTLRGQLLVDVLTADLMENTDIAA